MSGVTAPLDATHADCLAARRWVNRRYAAAKRRAATWRPAPRACRYCGGDPVHETWAKRGCFDPPPPTTERNTP